MLTIGEMRAKAGVFVREWEGETSERAEAQSFWNDWFAIFGLNRRRTVGFERNVKKLSERWFRSSQSNYGILLRILVGCAWDCRNAR